MLVVQSGGYLLRCHGCRRLHHLQQDVGFTEQSYPRHCHEPRWHDSVRQRRHRSTADHTTLLSVLLALSRIAQISGRGYRTSGVSNFNAMPRIMTYAPVYPRLHPYILAIQLLVIKSFRTGLHCLLRGLSSAILEAEVLRECSHAAVYWWLKEPSACLDHFSTGPTGTIAI
jgi:hypothetical protein